MQLLTNELALIFYEIALSIGNSLDLRAMLKESLFTYLKRLNCTSAGVFVLHKNMVLRCYERLYAIPRNAQQDVESYLASQETEALSLPTIVPWEKRRYLHLMDLPGFGLLYLIKQGEPLDEYVIQSLAPLNRKLASACHSCRQQQALQESETRIRTILDSVQAGIVIIDKQSHVVKAVNPVAAWMIGRSEEEIIDSECHRFICPTDRGDCPITDCGQTVDNSERVLLGPQGRRIPILKTITTIDLNGHPHLLESFIDVSELHFARRQLQETISQLQRTNKDLRDFAYVAAHDLKTPLRGIATVTDWLEIEHGETLTDGAKEYLSILRQKTHRMYQLIDGLLRYSDIEIARAPQVGVDVKQLVAEVVHDLAPPETMRIETDALPQITCHRSLFYRLFHHLIDNALRWANPSNGWVRIGHNEADDVHRFSVTDNGPGIPSRYHTKIFQIFQMLSPDDTSKSTGIGLATAKKIVELHGGKIWVESEPGQGATFHFTVPKSAA